MNIGIANASGDYIAILESDDFALPCMIQKLYSAAIMYHADVVVGSFYVYYEETGEQKMTNEFHRLEHEGILTDYDREIVILAQPSIWKGIYKRTFLLDEGIRFLETPGASYQDTSFAFKTIMYGKCVAAIKDPVLCYRRGHQTASVKSNDKVFCICEEFEEIKNSMTEKRYLEWKNVYSKALFKRYLWNYQRLSGDNAAQFRDRFLNDLEELKKEKWLKREKWSDWEWGKLENFIEFTTNN
jgi:glycosyltransferase involved in cell wall biosynthesis